MEIPLSSLSCPSFAIFTDVLVTELLRRDVDATARRHHDVHGLVDDVDALEHVHQVVVVGNGDAEHTNVVHGQYTTW